MIDIVGPASALNAVTSRPSDGRYYGQTDSFFKDCTSPTSQDGTDVAAAWLNQVTGLFRNVIRSNGLKLDGVTPVTPYDQSDNMLLVAIQNLIQRGQLSYGRDQGTANNVLVSIPFVPAELIDGMEIRFRAKYPCSGPATISVNGNTPVPIVKTGATPLSGGEWAANDIVDLIYTGLGTFIMVGGGTITASAQLGLNVFQTAGAFTYIVPYGVNFILADLWGGGGSGGSVSSTSASAARGGGGGFTRAILSVTPGQEFAGVIGAGGAQPAAGNINGNNGSTSTFGSSLLSATGGAGGLGASSGFGLGKTAGGMGAGGNLNLPGGQGRSGFNSGSTYFGGDGGSAWSSGEVPFTQGSYHSGEMPGQGGSGASSNSGSIASGAGSNGMCVIQSVG